MKSGENLFSCFREEDFKDQDMSYMYIAQVQGQITPLDKISVVT